MFPNLEAWHLVLGLVGIGLSLLAWGFAAWSGAVKDMGSRLEQRLTRMEANSEQRWSDIAARMESHEGRIHDLHIQVERRVTYIEAKINGRKIGIGND